MNSFPSRHVGSGHRPWGRAGIKLSAILAVLMLVLSLCSIRAAGADDEYLNILSLIDQADILSGNGKADSAYTKYLQAWKELTEFKRLNPTFSPSAVSYRIKYLTGKLDSPGAKAAQSQAATAKAVGGVQVKLISAGTEPRKVLRLHPAAGDKQSLAMTITMSMEMATGGKEMPAMKMPPMQMRMDVAIKNVAASGDIDYETTVTDAGVAEDANASPQLAGGMEAAMGNLKGMTVAGVTTDRGVAKNVDFKLASGANPQMQQTLDQVKTAMSQVALPEEAVGVGAKWSVQRKIKTQGMMVDQTENYEIVALEDDNITLKTGVTQMASNQKIESPAAPGMKVDISKMETKGAGTATVNLGKLMPTAGSMDGHTEMSMGMDIGGTKQTMSMKMDLNAKIESK